MPPVSSLETELKMPSPAGSATVCTWPLARSRVPTTPCWLNHHSRPDQSTPVATRQSPSGRYDAIGQSRTRVRVPSAATATSAIPESVVVANAWSWGSRKK